MEKRSPKNSTINNHINIFYSSVWNTNFSLAPKLWEDEGRRLRKGWREAEDETIPKWRDLRQLLSVLGWKSGLLEYWQAWRRCIRKFSHNTGPGESHLHCSVANFKPNAKHFFIRRLLSAELIFISSCWAKLRGLYKGTRYWSRISWVFREIRKRILNPRLWYLSK